MNLQKQLDGVKRAIETQRILTDKHELFENALYYSLTPYIANYRMVGVTVDNDRAAFDFLKWLDENGKIQTAGRFEYVGNRYAPTFAPVDHTVKGLSHDDYSPSDIQVSASIQSSCTCLVALTVFVHIDGMKVQLKIGIKDSNIFPKHYDMRQFGKAYTSRGQRHITNVPTVKDIKKYLYDFTELKALLVK